MLRGNRPNDNLTDVIGALHRPEALNRIKAIEGLVNQWHEVAPLETIQHLAENAPRLFTEPRHEIVNVYREIAIVLSQRTNANSRILIKVLLAKFKEPTERREQVQTLLHSRFCKRIQDDINAFAVSDISNLLNKIQRAGI